MFARSGLPALPTCGAEADEAEADERERSRLGNDVGPPCRVVAADRVTDRGVVAAGVVRLHDDFVETGAAICGQVFVDLDSVDGELVGVGGEGDRKVHPGIVVDRSREVDPASEGVFPDTEAPVVVVVRETDDRVPGDTQAVGHHAPHVGANGAVRLVFPQWVEPQGRRQRIADTTGDAVFASLGIVERRVETRGPTAEAVVGTDADPENIIVPLKSADVRERIGFEPIRRPSRRDVGEIRHEFGCPHRSCSQRKQDHHGKSRGDIVEGSHCLPLYTFVGVHTCSYRFGHFTTLE